MLLSSTTGIVEVDANVRKFTFFCSFSVNLVKGCIPLDWGLWHKKRCSYMHKNKDNLGWELVLVVMENSNFTFTKTWWFQSFSVIDTLRVNFLTKGLQMLSLSHHSPSRMKNHLDQVTASCHSCSAFPRTSEMTCGKGAGMMVKVLHYVLWEICLEQCQHRFFYNVDGLQ